MYVWMYGWYECQMSMFDWLLGKMTKKRKALVEMLGKCQGLQVARLKHTD